jgi:hypothetical protein
MCKCLLESLRYSDSLGENCDVYMVGFSVEVISAEECGGEARSRRLRGGGSGVVWLGQYYTSLAGVGKRIGI